MRKGSWCPQSAVGFDYRGLAFPIPDRIRDCDLRSWIVSVAPALGGAGLSARDRPPNARAEDCALCRERAAALSAAAVSSAHAPDPLLPSAAVKAIHKLATDISPLSEGWYEQTTSAAGMSDARYVELLGVLVHVFTVDELHRAFDLPLGPLPEPLGGKPSQKRPAGAARGVSWVPIALPDTVDREDADIYEEMRRRPANVITALSLVPDNVRWLNDQFAAHYLSWSQMGELEARHAVSPAPAGAACDSRLGAQRVLLLNAPSRQPAPSEQS